MRNLIIGLAAGLVLGGGATAHAMSKPQPEVPQTVCHKVDTLVSQCTMRLDDTDGDYRIRLRIVVNHEPAFRATFKGVDY